jgi:hypothetical protein
MFAQVRSTSFFGTVRPVAAAPATSTAATSESSFDLASPSHTRTSTDGVSPMITPTALLDSPSHPEPLPFTVFTPPTNVFPSSHHVTHFIPQFELTQNTSGTHNPSPIGDHVDSLAIRPEVASTDGPHNAQMHGACQTLSSPRSPRLRLFLLQPR